MAKKPSKPRKKPVRTGVPINTNVDPDVRLAMDAYIDSYNETQEHKATVTSTVETALKAFLREKGFWPWPRKDVPPAK